MMTPTEFNDAGMAVIDGSMAAFRSNKGCAYHVGQIMLISRILAGDNWTTITIPRGGSKNFNQRVWGAGHYQTPTSEK